MRWLLQNVNGDVDDDGGGGHGGGGSGGDDDGNGDSDVIHYHLHHFQRGHNPSQCQRQSAIQQAS